MFLPESINCSSLLKRAKDLNYEYDPHKDIITRYLSSYDSAIFERNLQDIFPSMDNYCRKEIIDGNLDGALSHMRACIAKVYKVSKIKQIIVTSDDNSKMKDANDKFNELRNFKERENTESFDEKLSSYKRARNDISKEIYSKESNRWNDLMNDNESKKLWEKINWKGDTSKNILQPPIFEDMVACFEDLYTSEVDDTEKISKLETETYEPSLDDPITATEMDDAMNQMKNGGYDHRIEMFKLIKKVASPLILIFLNALFFVAYPIKLAISLLSAIPKIGDLSICKNYRGIQMLPALAVLYDRVLALRLTAWMCVRSVQSAFQKGKSTLHQLFVLRLLIELAKKNDITLYIGFFDLAKAFDKVSRYQMLKKLIARGVGNCMLQALKRLYMYTYCVLSFCNEYSDKFRTTSGIRQGAASSALLFIGFIDDLVEYLEARCQPEPFIDMLHCLLHADDTTIISTDRDLFIFKCNAMLDYFSENELKLNLSKSGYFIINGKAKDVKDTLILKNGNLDKSTIKYLGMKFSDTGKIKEDIDINIGSKRPNITIKFTNFCRKNFLSPLFVKLRVLNSCVTSSLLYGSEVWAESKVPKLESLYRQGLKIALSVRNNVCNEIVYIETGENPLELRITQQQLKFWSSIMELMNSNPNHYISKLVIATEDTPYIKYYKQITQQYTNAEKYAEEFGRNLKSTRESKIRAAAAADEASRLGTYFTINPTLCQPNFDGKLEFQRVLITKYRTGSHNLRIESGRTPYIAREERLCICNGDIQTINHVLLQCVLLSALREKYEVTDIESGLMNVCFLLEMEKILGID